MYVWKWSYLRGHLQVLRVIVQSVELFSSGGQEGGAMGQNLRRAGGNRER